MLRSIPRETFWLHQIKFFTMLVSGIGGGGPLPLPPPRLVLRCRSRIKILSNFAQLLYFYVISVGLLTIPLFGQLASLV